MVGVLPLISEVAAQNLRFDAMVKRLDFSGAKELVIAHKPVTSPGLTKARVMVCLSSSVLAPRVLRAGAQIAEHLGVTWYAVHVATPEERPSKIQQRDAEVLQDNMTLAKYLGATVVTLNADRVADGLIVFAQRERITHVILGQRARSRWKIFREGSVIDRILSTIRDAVVHVIPVEDRAV